MPALAQPPSPYVLTYADLRITARPDSWPEAAAEFMLEFACLRDDTSQLDCALKFSAALPPDTPRELAPTLAWPHAIRHALMPESNANDWQPAAQELAKRARAAGLIAALEAQFQRLRGYKRMALACHQRAQGNLDATSPEITPDLLLLAIHRRNALALIASDENDQRLAGLRASSARWLRNHIGRGYVAFNS